jgi:hypothetical protein
MRNYTKTLGVIAGVVFFGINMAMAGSAMATGAGGILQNAGLGQKAGDPNNFGIAVCNNGSQATSQAVPVSITANNTATTLQIPAPLNAKQCTYSYVPYSSFSMKTGVNYSVQVTIDSNRTFATNPDTSATYSVTVPGGAVLGATTMSDSERATLTAQLSAMIAQLQVLLAEAQAQGK